MFSKMLANVAAKRYDTIAQPAISYLGFGLMRRMIVLQINYPFLHWLTSNGRAQVINLLLGRIVQVSSVAGRSLQHQFVQGSSWGLEVSVFSRSW